MPLLFLTWWLLGAVSCSPTPAARQRYCCCCCFATVPDLRSLPELADLLGPAPQDPTSTNTDASTRRTPPSHASHHGQEGLHEDATQRMGMRARAARLALRQPLTPIPLTAAATTLARLIQDAPRHLPKHAAARQDDAHAVECIVGRLCWDLGRYSDTGSLALRDRVSQRLQRHAHDARGVASVIRALGITRCGADMCACAVRAVCAGVRHGCGLMSVCTARTPG